MPNLTSAFVAVVLSFGLAGASLASEFTGATAAAASAIDGTIFAKLLSDPLSMAAVMIGICLFASKVLKVDLTALLPLILNSLMKPPSTTPAIPPVVTTPTVPAVPVVPVVVPAVPDINATIQMLLNMLIKARVDGDKEQEAAALKLIDKLRV